MYNYSSGRIVFQNAIAWSRSDLRDSDEHASCDRNGRGPAGPARSPIRVAVAGATGFAGQELIRLLSRHPHVTITAATGSQANSTPRQLAVALEDLGRHRGAAERRGLRGGCRVSRAAGSRVRRARAGAARERPARDRSCRAHFVFATTATRAKLYPATGRLAEGRRLRTHGVRARRDQVGAPAVESRAATPPRRCWACCRCSAPGC